MKAIGRPGSGSVGLTLTSVLMAVLLVTAGCRPSTAARLDQAVGEGCSFAADAVKREIGRAAKIATDTSFQHPLLDATRRGCVVHLEDSTGEAPLVQMRAAFQSEGWASQLGYMADGPDGSVEGFLHAGTLCTIRGEWDGGDDSDSTYVPAPGYRFTVNCWRAFPEDLK